MWMKNIKNIIFLLIGLIFFIWIVFTQIKCNKLQKQLNEVKIENLFKIDSLELLNRQHLNTIHLYEAELFCLKSEVDSLEKIKQQIIVKKDGVIVSNNTTIAVKKLKDNLKKCEN